MTIKVSEEDAIVTAVVLAECQSNAQAEAIAKYVVLPENRAEVMLGLINLLNTLAINANAWKVTLTGVSKNFTWGYVSLEAFPHMKQRWNYNWDTDGPEPEDDAMTHEIAELIKEFHVANFKEFKL